MADIYIDKWYFDDTSKKSPYDDLESGNIRLAIVVEPANSENPCESANKVPEGHTIIGIEAQLPRYK